MSTACRSCCRGSWRRLLVLAAIAAGVCARRVQAAPNRIISPGDVSSEPQQDGSPPSAVQITLDGVQRAARDDILSVPSSRAASSSAPLVVISLDGNVTALRSSTGEVLWTVSTGRQLVQSVDFVRSAASRSEDSARRTHTEALIIPGTDGRIFVRTAGGTLEQLPHRAQEIVNRLPIASEEHVIVGSKHTDLMHIGMQSGSMTRVTGMMAATSACPAGDSIPDPSPAPDTSSTDADALLWLARSDFHVHAYSPVTRQSVWNMTYSEVIATDAVIPRAEDVEAALRAAGVTSTRHSADLAANGELPFIPAWSTARGATGRSMLLLSLSTSPRGELIALNAMTGSVVWKYAGTGAPIQTVHVAVTAQEGTPRVRPFPVALQMLWPAPAEVPGLPMPEDGYAEWHGEHDVSSVHSAPQARSRVVAQASTEDSQVVLAMLANGQVYAMPRSRERAYASSMDLSAASLLPAITAEHTYLLPAPPQSTNDGACVGDECANALPYGLHNVTVPISSTSAGSRTPEPISRVTVSFSPLVVLLSSVAATYMWRDASQQPAIAQSLQAAYDVFGVLTTLIIVCCLVVIASALALPSSRGGTFRIVRELRSRLGLQPASEPGIPTIPESPSDPRAKPADRQESAGAPPTLPLLTPVPVTPSTAPAEVIVNGIPHRSVGRLLVSDVVVGRGCQGTMVYRGMFESRPVAVKRMLRTHTTPANASREIALLIRTDGHANVVRYYAYEESTDFMYLALELCVQSLAEAVAECAQRFAAADAAQRADGRSSNRFRAIDDDDDDADAAARARRSPIPVPTPSTRRFLRELVEGIAYLHSHNIVHRDIKPHNILLAARPSRAALGTSSHHDMMRVYLDKEHHSLGLSFTPKISDFGLGKLLVATDASSHYVSSSAIHGHTADTSSLIAPGSVGWQAPEVLQRRVALQSPTSPDLARVEEEDSIGSTPAAADGTTILADDAATAGKRDARWQRSRSSDIWSLGCVLYFVLDANVHPYGEIFKREDNILRGRADLRRLQAASPEAHALIASMLSADPAARPTAAKVLEHPLFWDDDARLSFLRDVSNHMEQLTAGDALLTAMDARGADVFGGSGWSGRIPASLLTDSGKYRSYTFTSLVDLLRLLRNKHSHYNELPLHVRKDVIGSDSPSALAPFFMAPGRFPRLLQAVYEFVVEFLAHEGQFARQLGPHTVAAAASAAKAASARLRAMVVSRKAVAVAAPAPSPAPRPAPRAAARAAASSSTPVVVIPPVTEADADRPASPRLVFQREWYVGAPDAWLAAAHAVSERAERVSGGRLVAATVEKGETPPAGRAHVMVVAAHAHLVETSFKGGAHTLHPRYKSQPCKDWDEKKGSHCPRGVRCDFAHGPVELRPLVSSGRITRVAEDGLLPTTPELCSI